MGVGNDKTENAELVYGVLEVQFSFSQHEGLQNRSVYDLHQKVGLFGLSANQNLPELLSENVVSAAIFHRLQNELLWVLDGSRNHSLGFAALKIV